MFKLFLFISTIFSTTLLFGANTLIDSQKELSAQNLGDKTILETNFFENNRDRSAKKTGSFSGTLPEPWRQDFAHFMDADVTAKVVNLGPEHYLRINATKGSPQFSAPVSGIKPNTNYRLTAYARNLTGVPVKMSLRIVPAPYTTLTAGELKAGKDWNNQTVYFKTPAQTITLPVALMMNFEDPGIVDIVSMKLEECEDLAAASVRRPDAASKNYFRTTRFPLGLQSGWCYMRNRTYGTIEPDPDVKGPSGEFALRLKANPGKELGLCSEPFCIADPNVKNAVSFAYRGTGRTRVEVYSEGKCLANLTLAASQEWKRAVLSFQAPRDSRAFTVRILGEGTLWVDAFRANPESDTAYIPAGECEVAMALPKTDTSASRIQFDDEKSLVKYFISGKTDGVVLKGKVVNLYGESVELKSVSVKDRAGMIDYTAFPEKPYGQFRVELQAFRDGKAVSPVSELVVTRLKRPVYWKMDAPHSAFGIHVLSFDDSVKAVKAAGINWARLHDAGTEYIGWFFLEPSRKIWEFRDDDIASYRKNHIKIFGQLGTAPKWASYLSKVDTGRKYISYHDRYFQPLDLNEFKNYVTTVVKRYTGVIDDWFVWNEPWIVSWWGVGYDKNSTENSGYITSKNPQADFVKMTECAYLAAKEVNPNAKISGFNTTFTGLGQRWTQGVYDAGGLNFCDMVDFHFYTPRNTGYPGDACQGAVDDALGYIVRKNGKIGKPVYMSEGQGASHGGSSGDNSLRYAGLYKHTLPWENKEDYDSIADRNVRYTISLLNLGISKVFLYSAHCYMDFSQAPQFLVMFNADGTPHPMLAAYSALTSRIENMKSSGLVKIGNDTWVYLFSDGKKSVGVISGKYAARGGKVSCALPDAKGADLYGNPIVFPTVYKGTVVYVEAPCAPEKLASSLKLE